MMYVGRRYIFNFYLNYFNKSTGKKTIIDFFWRMEFIVLFHLQSKKKNEKYRSRKEVICKSLEKTNLAGNLIELRI